MKKILQTRYHMKYIWINITHNFRKLQFRYVTGSQVHRFKKTCALSADVEPKNQYLLIKKNQGKPIPASPDFLSLLSDSNQRPRDYKSRALAN